MTNQTASSTRRWRTPIAALVLAGTGLFSALSLQAQVAAPGTKAMSTTVTTTTPALAPSSAPRYNDKWEIYGGLNLSNGQAGQNLPKRYNMGGGEILGTYWLTSHLGVAGDYRIQAGTTPVLPAASVFGLNRVTVRQNIFSGGVQWRGPKNRYFAIDYHALGGATRGTFDTAVINDPANSSGQVPTTQLAGLYSNSTSPFGAVGGSIDFNYAPRVAVRIQPDLTFEHFGTETREFFSISAGLVYRFGKR